MNIELSQELIAMAEEDQRVLQQLFESGALPSDQYHPDMKAVHECHAAALKEIIVSHGWPGISMVGRKASESAWLIVQHAVSDLEFMSECIEILRRAVAAGEAEGWQLAFLQDRVFTMTGKKQYYGTQFDVDDDGWPTPFPIMDHETVNIRRAALGMNSLEERLEQMHEREHLRRKHRSSNGEQRD